MEDFDWSVATHHTKEESKYFLEVNGGQSVTMVGISVMLTLSVVNLDSGTRMTSLVVRTTGKVPQVFFCPTSLVKALRACCISAIIVYFTSVLTVKT